MTDGFVILFRCMQLSDLWFANPFYLKVWLYLLFNAQYADHGNLKRGQLFTSTATIADSCYMKKGYIIQRPTKDQVRAALDFLRADHDWPFVDSNGAPIHGPMITTRKVTHGMLVTLCNYEFLMNYQNSVAPSESPSVDEANGSVKASRKDDDNSIGAHNKNNNTNIPFNMKKSPAEPDMNLSSLCISVAEKTNSLAGSKFCASDFTEYVEALLNKGYSISDIESVIERKTLEWRENESMRGNIRPSVLLNANRFGEYLSAPAPLFEISFSEQKSKVEKLKKELEKKETSLLAIKDSLIKIDKREQSDEYHILKDQEAALEDSIAKIEKILKDNAEPSNYDFIDDEDSW